MTKMSNPAYELKNRTSNDNFALAVKKIMGSYPPGLDSREEMVGRLVPVNLTCIATFQDFSKGQEIFDLRGVLVLKFHPLAPPEALAAMEFSIVRLIIDSLKQDREDLVKISVCYSGKALQFDSRQEAIQNGFGYIVRCDSKYYFQPDQLDEVTRKLKLLDPILARDTGGVWD